MLLLQVKDNIHAGSSLTKGRFVRLIAEVYMQTKCLGLAVGLIATVALHGCKHPLAIVGEGDIVDVSNSGRGCTLEQFRARDKACTKNEVSGDYFVNYKAVPRPGWRFVRWDGPCPPDSDFQHCGFKVSKAAVDWWDQTYPNRNIPPSTAVFSPITGETGYLLAGTPVTGVAWETATQQGVTGLDGSFQYEIGEAVQFTIGDTLLGKVAGREQITPFDLADSPVLTGIDITWALQHRADPYQTVINLAVLLHSLDKDGDPDNGIEIRPGIASLLNEIALDLRKPWDSGEAGIRAFEERFHPWMTFQTDPTFRHVLGRARRAHRFSTPHGIADPAATLATLYGGMGIEPNIVGLSQLQVSQSGESDQFETTYYDANGNITRHENTQYGDAYEIWQYDDHNKVTRHKLDASEFGQNFVETWHYDAAGNLTRFERSDRIDIRTYLYDGDGNPIRESWNVNETGNVNVVDYAYRYDKLGRLQQFTSKENDGFRFSNWKFNARGDVIHHEEHYGNQEPYGNDAETWIYDSNGNLIRHESNFPWSPETGKYNADGKLIRWEQKNTWCDRGCYRLATTWEYDDNGKVVLRKTEDLESDSVLEVDTWLYDESGRVILREGDPLSGDEIVTETWEYYVDGVIKRHVINGGNENLVNQYDRRGNLTLESTVNDVEQSIETWNYDAAGNPVYRTWDSASDRLIDDSIAYQYTATGWHHLFSGIKVYGQPYRPPIKPAPSHEERPPNDDCNYQIFFYEMNNC
jgi:YD repeat-containing protein